MSSTVAPWHTLKVGDPILSDAYFDVGYRSDFSKPLDGGYTPGGILGTQKGFKNNPFNFTYPTDGQFKTGGYLQFHQNYATGYRFPFTSNQRNKEPQHYVHFHGEGSGSPSANPYPMSFFSVENGALVMRARPTTEEEKSWARVSGFAIDENGNEATVGWFRNNGGIPGGWGANRTDDGTDETAKQLVYFHNMPAPYASTMISTNNRASMSFGRSMSEVSFPLGAKWNGRDINDLRNLHTWFSAFWDLEDIPARCDINGRLHNKDTYTPASVGASGIHNELDTLEIFFSKDIHITSHHYKEGYNPYIQKRAGYDVISTALISKNHTPPYEEMLRDTPVIVGNDRFPPVGNIPGYIMYHVNGIIHTIYEMPEYLGQPKILYEQHPDLSYLPLLNKDGTVKRLGSQVYNNRKPAYTHWFQIWNMAMSAPFTLRLAAIDFKNTPHSVPEFRENEKCTIKWTRMDPLNILNPDSRPLIRYVDGEFGGSSSLDQGPIIKGIGAGTTPSSGSGVVVPGDVLRSITDKSPIEEYVSVHRRPGGGHIYFPKFKKE